MFVERHDVGVAIVIAVDDNQVFVKNRASIVSVGTNEITDFGLPREIPLKVVGGDNGFTRGDHSFSADVRGDHFIACDSHEGDVD